MNVIIEECTGSPAHDLHHMIRVATERVTVSSFTF
jgi:hypothetical protein